MKLVDAKHIVIINKGAQRFYFIYLFSVCCCCLIWGELLCLVYFCLFVGFLPMNNCPLKQLGLGKISRILSLA